MRLPDFQNALNKPYYFFRPKQVFLRLNRKLSGPKPAAAYEQVVLPWGLPIRVRPFDMIGSAIIRTGVYDLCVSEVLWRLLDPAETAIDAGANIGQMTSVMAKRVAGTGKVLSFEPHPQVFQELSANVALWKAVPEVGRVELYEMGLSKEAGVAGLHTTTEFASNRGTASLEADGLQADGGDGVAHSVVIERLDTIVDNNAPIGVMKIDVEGHELSLLQGAARLLTERRIRDIVFEEKAFYPSPVTEHLEHCGYEIFSIKQGPFAVRVSPAGQDEVHYKYEAQSYLATLDTPRALQRLGTPGYQALQTERNNRGKGLLPRIAVGLVLLLTVSFLASKKRQK